MSLPVGPSDPNTRLEKLLSEFTSKPSKDGINGIISFVDKNISRLSQKSLAQFDNFERSIHEKKHIINLIDTTTSKKLQSLSSEISIIMDSYGGKENSPTSGAIPISKPKSQIYNQQSVSSLNEIITEIDQLKQAMDNLKSESDKKKLCTTTFLKFKYGTPESWQNESDETRPLNERKDAKIPIFYAQSYKAFERIYPHNLFSAYGLAKCYHEGIGVEKNIDESLRILLKIHNAPTQDPVLSFAVSQLIKESSSQ